MSMTACRLNVNEAKPREARPAGGYARSGGSRRY